MHNFLLRLLPLVFCLFGSAFAAQRVSAQVSVTHTVYDASAQQIGSITFSTTNPGGGPADFRGHLGGVPFSGQMTLFSWVGEVACWRWTSGAVSGTICFSPGFGGTIGVITDSNNNTIGYTFG